MILWLKNLFKPKRYCYLVSYMGRANDSKNYTRGMVDVSLTFEWGRDDHVFVRNWLFEEHNVKDAIITSVMPIKDVYNTK